MSERPNCQLTALHCHYDIIKQKDFFVCVSVCRSLSMSRYVRCPQRPEENFFPQEVELQVLVVWLMLVLGPKLGSSGRSLSTFSHWPLGNTVLNLHGRLGRSLVVIHCCLPSHCWGLCFSETVANGCSLTPGWFWRGHGGAFSRAEVRREGQMLACQASLPSLDVLVSICLCVCVYYYL